MALRAVVAPLALTASTYASTQPAASIPSSTTAEVAAAFHTATAINTAST